MILGLIPRTASRAAQLRTTSISGVRSMTPSSFFLSMVSPFLFKHVEGNLSQNQKQEPVKEGTGTNGSQGARYEAQLHQQVLFTQRTAPPIKRDANRARRNVFTGKTILSSR